jgi:low temperature requirement protein LtrA
MSIFAATNNQLRVRHGHDHHRVTFVELFFDLVFVFAVTQLSHGLLKHLTLLGAVQTALLMLAVWWVWIYTTWFTNWCDPDRPAVRLMLGAMMLAGLVLSCSIPRAFEDRALPFALAYVSMQVGRNGFMLWVLRLHDAANFRNFTRIFLWFAAAAPFWIAGAFSDGNARLWIWSVAIAIEYLAAIANFRVPGLGRSSTTDWQIEGGHIAERCALFIIIALGESILITGATFADLPWNATTISAFVVAFVGSVAMWAIYFNIGAERASRQIAASDDPGRMARSGYTYLHLLIIAGIIVAAVGDELVLHQPDGHDGHTAISTTAAIVGGPALYLVGNALFKRLSTSNLPLSHLVGLALLALLAPAAMIATPLVLSAGTTAILIIVAAWEWLSLGRDKTADVASY